MPLPDTRRSPVPNGPGPEQTTTSEQDANRNEAVASGPRGAGTTDLPVIRPASLPLEPPEILATIIVEVAGYGYAMALAAELILASNPAVTR